MSKADLYKILEISPSATPEEIKRAYRRLARIYHPDSPQSSVESADGQEANSDQATTVASKSFLDIQTAYEVLSDPSKRKQYDQSKSENSRRPKKTSIWEPDSFSQSLRSALKKQPGSRKVSRSRSKSASSGSRPKRSSAQKVARPRKKKKRGTRVFDFTIDAHESLMGTKREIIVDNSGADDAVAVPIPAGIVSGSTITVPNNPEKKTQRAMRARVWIVPHPLVERDGVDITVKLPISVNEAINGTELEVPTLNGPVIVRLPANWDLAKRLRIPGSGVRDPLSGETGEFYVKPYIVLPRASQQKLTEVSEEIDKLYVGDIRAGVPTNLRDIE